MGFDTIDFGSFVSPRAIPQMADTAKVINGLELDHTDTKLLAIVANERGAQDAAAFDQIDFLGFPFSISETFQKRNTNSTIAESFKRVEEMKSIADASGKGLVVYISMAFGNPYGDAWHPDIVAEWCGKLHRNLGIENLSLADTVGSSTAASISELFTTVLNAFRDVEIGAHLHTTPSDWEAKLNAAYLAGCRRFDGAMMGYGGCPMAAEELTGNMPTEKMVGYFSDHKIPLALEADHFAEALKAATKVFS